MNKQELKNRIVAVVRSLAVLSHEQREEIALTVCQALATMQEHGQDAWVLDMFTTEYEFEYLRINTSFMDEEGWDVFEEWNA